MNEPTDRAKWEDHFLVTTRTKSWRIDHHDTLHLGPGQFCTLILHGRFHELTNPSKFVFCNVNGTEWYWSCRSWNIAVVIVLNISKSTNLFWNLHIRLNRIIFTDWSVKHLHFKVIIMIVFNTVRFFSTNQRVVWNLSIFTARGQCSSGVKIKLSYTFY